MTINQIVFQIMVNFTLNWVKGIASGLFNLGSSHVVLCVVWSIK